MSAPLSDHLLAQFSALVGSAYALSEPEAQQPYLREWRDLYQGSSPLVLRPGSVAEVSAILKLAHETGTAIVPQGGNTGLVGGQIPGLSRTCSDESLHAIGSSAGSSDQQAGRPEIVVSLNRLNAIRSVDPTGNTMIVEAGVPLYQIQKAAHDVDRLFPLSLGSEGTCQIGGNLSTNAGGTAVLSYGNTRDLALGLEVVLADGTIWHGLRALRKDNTGYDLKHLFIGAEGTLGIITAAVLKLFPKPQSKATAFLGLPSPEHALAVFNHARALAGPALTGFELMPRIGLDFVLKHSAGTRHPLAQDHAWYCLLELSNRGDAQDGEALLETILSDALEVGWIDDGAVAQSGQQSDAFWHLRLAMSEVQKAEGGSIKHDISVPVASVPAFLEEAIAAVEAFLPGCRPVPFGHLGDGNIHFNISQPVDMNKANYLAQWDTMNAVVHKIVLGYGGSISAEHGIGFLKRDLLQSVKDPVELAIMRALKQALDPQNILNPGKVLTI